MGRSQGRATTQNSTGRRRQASGGIGTHDGQDPRPRRRGNREVLRPTVLNTLYSI